MRRISLNVMLMCALVLSDCYCVEHAELEAALNDAGKRVRSMLGVAVEDNVGPVAAALGRLESAEQAIASATGRVDATKRQIDMQRDTIVSYAKSAKRSKTLKRNRRAKSEEIRS